MSEFKRIFRVLLKHPIHLDRINSIQELTIGGWQ